MYVLSYFLVLGLVTYVVNQTNEVESNNEFLKWDQKDLVILGVLALVGIILQVFSNFLKPLVLLLYVIACCVLVFLVNKNREKHIKEYKRQVEQVFEATKKLTAEKEIDYNNLPFSIERDGEKINKITMLMKEPDKYNDSVMSNTVFTLKRYFPYYDWQYSADFPKQQAIFSGQKLPPDTAMWPGSDLRDSSYFPLGLGGNGEVGLDFGSKDYGQSMYVYEDGSTAGTIKLASAPHCLCVGSTGGGKAIWVDQEIW